MLLDVACSFLHLLDMANTEHLLKRVRDLAEATGQSTATLSRKLFGNGQRFDEIERGGSLTMTTYERVAGLLSEMEAEVRGRAAA